MVELAVNNLDQLNGRPGVHAFIVGVSDYSELPESAPGRPQTFELLKLNSPALSAFRFFQWLTGELTHPMTEEVIPVKLVHPLATCHLLLSPSQSELVSEPKLADLAGMPGFPRATMAEFQSCIQVWRRLCAMNRENQAIFYFCGHGVESLERDAVLLLEDFAKVNLDSAVVRVATIFNGMAPHKIPGEDFTEIARQQIYFIDACRDKPEALSQIRNLNGQNVFTDALADEDDRDAPIFFSTVPGDRAWGMRGNLSIFTASLLEGVLIACEEREDDDDANPIWPVRAQFLHNVIRRRIERLNLPVLQRLGNLSGYVGGDPVICYLPDAPPVEVQLTIQPDMVTEDIALQLNIDALPGNGRVWTISIDPRPDHPFTFQLPLGFYKLEASCPGFESKTDTWFARADNKGSLKTLRLAPATS